MNLRRFTYNNKNKIHNPFTTILLDEEIISIQLLFKGQLELTLNLALFPVMQSNSCIYENTQKRNLKILVPITL